MPGARHRKKKRGRRYKQNMMDSKNDEHEEDVCSEAEDFLSLSQFCSESNSTNEAEFNDFIQRKRTGLEIKDRYLTTGCPALDQGFNGGIPGFGLTEFAGQAGSGKTQLCLQLCLTVQLPENLGGFHQGAVYINTESIFPSKRLAELTQHFKNRFKENLPDDPMENISLNHVADGAQLVQCVTKNLPQLLKEKSIGLIILDSIAAVFRSEYNSSSKRTSDMRLVGRTLHDIACRNKIALVVVNQVTANIKTEKDIPSLGMTWKNLVTTRIQLVKDNEQRLFSVLFSPHIQERNVPFVIESTGVRYVQL